MSYTSSFKMFMDWSTIECSSVLECVFQLMSPKGRNRSSLKQITFRQPFSNNLRPRITSPLLIVMINSLAGKETALDSTTLGKVAVRFIGQYEYSDDGNLDGVTAGYLYVVSTHYRSYYVSYAYGWPDWCEESNYFYHVVTGNYLLKLLNKIREFNDKPKQHDWREVGRAVLRFTRKS